MNIRKQLADALREILPPDWTVVAHGLDLENPRKPVVVVRQTTTQRTPGAPRLYRDFGFTVALVEPGLDLALVEDALDTDLDLVIDALEAVDLPGLVWTDANRATFDNRFHGYEINATITTERESKP